MKLEDIDSVKNKVVTSMDTDVYHFQLRTEFNIIGHNTVACAVRDPKSAPRTQDRVKLGHSRLENKRPCKRCIRTLDSQLNNIIKSCDICQRINILQEDEYVHFFMPHGMEDNKNTDICNSCFNEIKNENVTDE